MLLRRTIMVLRRPRRRTVMMLRRSRIILLGGRMALRRTVSIASSSSVVPLAWIVGHGVLSGEADAPDVLETDQRRKQ